MDSNIFSTGTDPYFLEDYAMAEMLLKYYDSVSSDVPRASNRADDECLNETVDQQQQLYVRRMTQLLPVFVSDVSIPSVCGGSENVPKNKESEPSECSSYSAIHASDHGQPCFECEICQKRFKRKDKLKDHMVTHSEERPHQCEICDQRFKRMWELRFHKKRKHPRENTDAENIIASTSAGTRYSLGQNKLRLDGSLKCFMCAMHLINTEDLLTHKRKCVHERSHECETCSKRFQTRTRYEKHLLFHLNQRPHECEICRKSIKRKADLKKHLLSHSNQRPHECEICHKRFKSKGDLKKHQLSHSNERPHECEVCQKRFSRRDHLKTHLHVHSNER